MTKEKRALLAEQARLMIAGGADQDEVSRCLGVSVHFISRNVLTRGRPADGKVRRYLKPIGPKPLTSPEVEIAREIANHALSSLREIRSPSRAPRLTHIRARIVHRLHPMGLSHADLGEVINRERTTVLHLLHTYRPDGTRIVSAQ